MSETAEDTTAGLDPAARALLARAARADARARALLREAVDDLFIAPQARLDDRTRVALSDLIEALVASIEADVAAHAAQLLEARGEPALGDALRVGRVPIAARIAASGLLKDTGLIGECIARVRCELMSAALPAEAPPARDMPGLLIRLTESSDAAVASAAKAVLAGESARRAVIDGATMAASGLPRDLHARLAWWVAAALRERAMPVSGARRAALDRAIAEAAARNLSLHDNADRLEDAAMRLAAAIDAQPDELPPLLDEAMGNGRLTVVIALIAHALDLPFDLMRGVTLDPSGERLWLALRALDLPRSAIARIGFALCEVDRDRDAEAFADELDAAAAIDADAARDAIAPLGLPAEYRAALIAIDRRARPR